MRVLTNTDERPEETKLLEPSVKTKRDAVKLETLTVSERVAPLIVGPVPKTSAPVPVSSEIESIISKETPDEIRFFQTSVKTRRDAVNPEKRIVPLEVIPAAVSI